MKQKIDNWFNEFELGRDKNELIKEMIRYEWLSLSNDGGLKWTDDRAEKYVYAFLSMNRFFEFHEIEYADCPCFFSMAQPRLTSKSARQYSPFITAIQDKTTSGAAFSKRQAAESCLGEAIETLSMVRTGKENLVYDSYNNLKDMALHPNEVIQYSEEQYKNRIEWNKNHLSQHHIPEPFNDEMVMSWAKLKNMLTGENVLYPAKLLYWGFEYEQPNYCNADSNGCAVGETEEEAQNKALLELIERDAAGIWWYGRLRKPGIPHELIEDQNVLNLIQWLKKLNRKVEFLDITTDFGIPVIVAVSYNSDGGTVALGYGCSFDIQAAISHSITEMMQMIVSIHMLEQRLELLPDKSPNEDELEFIHWIDEVNIKKYPFLTSQDKRHKPLKETTSLTTMDNIIHNFLQNKTKQICVFKDSIIDDFGYFFSGLTSTLSNKYIQLNCDRNYDFNTSFLQPQDEKLNYYPLI